MFNCRFCRYSIPNPTATTPWDRVLVRSPDEIVLPSKGALVSGWFLVVPTAHVLSSAALPLSKREGFGAMVAATAERVRAIWGNAVLFEHGASKEGTTFGCGIDHAHVHVVPLDFDFRAAVFDALGSSSWVGADAPWRRETGEPYLTFSTDSETWLRATPVAPPHQFFRRVIAAAVGTPLDYHYDEHPKEQNVASSVEVFCRHWSAVGNLDTALTG
ncbi:MAG: hypothetical protein ACOY0T_15840 [Myxococcota bacterium]